MSIMDIYDKLGMMCVVNASFPLTILGGSCLPQEVMDAVIEANKSFAWIWDMEEQAGKIIARLTGAEAAHVTAGTFSGIVLSAAACMAGKDREKMARLPFNTIGMCNEFIIQRCLRRLKYDRALEVAGGKIVRVGERSRCRPEQIEAAINEKTAGIFYLAPGPGDWPGPGYGKGTAPGYEVAKGAVPIEEVIEIANEKDVPIIVDAAGQSYPIDGFRRYVRMGADLVCYSSKYFMGPNSAGFVIGRKDLIDAVFYSNFIGCENYPVKQPTITKYLPDDQYNVRNSPSDPQGINRTFSIGRGYKLDRIEIVATVDALQRWMKMDHEKERFEPAKEKAQYIMEKLEGISGIKMEIGPYDYHLLPLNIYFKDKTPEEVAAINSELLEGDPVIWVRHAGVLGPELGPVLVFNMLFLVPGDEEIIAERLNEILS